MLLDEADDFGVLNLRQARIEEDDIRLHILDDLDRLHSLSDLPHDLEALLAAQQAAERFPEEPLGDDDDHADRPDRKGRGLTLAPSRMQGGG